VIDTHEHLKASEDGRAEDKKDVLSEYLGHYIRSDTVSAGFSAADMAVMDAPGTDIMKKWDMIEPYWEYSRFTGYGRALDISVKKIYGIDGINRSTVRELNERFTAAKKPGHYRRVLRELCNIETGLLDDWTLHSDGDNEFFKYVWQPQCFIKPFSRNELGVLDYIGQAHGIRVKSLDDWVDAIEAEVAAMIKLYGVRILKCSLAYERTLRFEEVGYSRAKDMFAEALGRDELYFERELQDYMMHAVLSAAGKHNATFQFHTGLLEGNGNVLSNSDPLLMENLFLKYPDVDFDLFHIAYPFQGAACALAKMFPNVYLDMCWAHIISPSASVSALHDFLDAVPYNKISAFGGDYVFVDGVYGHLQLSFENVSRVLSEKVYLGVFGDDKALEIAKALYYDNPKRIFKL
jgi:hypothetical protein